MSHYYANFFKLCLTFSLNVHSILSIVFSALINLSNWVEKSVILSMEITSTFYSFHIKVKTFELSMKEVKEVHDLEEN